MKESSFAPKYLEIADFTPNLGTLRIKRMFDVTVAGLTLLVLLPLLLVIAALIRVTSRGPVLYRQKRLGQHRRTFVLLKFRTMVDGADRMMDKVIHLNTASGPLFKAKNDPRITWIGKLLRRSFLDEIPQLINVLRGEMSIVGPRPCLPAEERHMHGDAGLRFMVPQGLTGPWQVNGHNDMEYEEQVAVERDYVMAWSLQTDLGIILRTIPLVFGARGL